MATLWITVFEGATQTASGDVIQVSNVAVTGASDDTYPIAGDERKRRIVRLFSDADCHVTWGAAPTADTTHMPLGAENPEYISVESGHVVSVIQRV